MNAPTQNFLGTGHDLAQWRTQVERAINSGGGFSTFEMLADGIDEGRYFMFAREDGFVVVDPQQWPSGIHLVVLVGGGSQAALEALEPVVRIWGQMIGAKKIVTFCRNGFWRRVRKQGWKKARIVLEKEIA